MKLKSMVERIGSSSERSPISLGESFEKQISLTPEEISAFSRMSGDLNPLHHDEQIYITGVGKVLVVDKL